MTLPDGFDRFTGARGFSTVLGDIWLRRQPSLVFAVRPMKSGCNGQSIVHGGYISTFADIALVHGAAQGLRAEAVFVTASLTVDFLCPCASEEWLYCAPEIVTMGARRGLACARLWSLRDQVAFAKASIVRVDRETLAGGLQGAV